jgi:hypothetical protein
MKRVGVVIVLLAVSLMAWAENALQGTVLSGGTWTGLALEQPCVITAVSWTRTNTSGGSQTVLLGIFEGSNREDFMDALPLAIVDDETVTYKEVNCSRGFRYVRFVAPKGKSCSGIEVAFYGIEGAGDDSHLSQLTNLPVVSIHTRDNQAPYDKEHEIEAYISIVSNDGQKLLSDTATIRERGNYSRSFPKKPYRIKFAHKHHVLGSPAKARKWTLINNYGDKTLMRNQLAFELSRMMQMPYTPFCAYVDVVLNGDYKGCYQLCDQIEVRPNRVEVAEMTQSDNSGDALTGGYLIEADAYAYEEQSMFWSNNGTGVTIKYPKEDSITYTQANYIERHYNKMEANWRRYLDLNTFMRHFLVGELSGNTDTYWSVYFYKLRSNDTLFVGPVWDFDLAFENDDRTYPINSHSDYIYRTCGSTTGNLRELVDNIVVKSTLNKRILRNLWADLRRAGLTEMYMTQYIDEQEALLMQSQRLNFLRWPIMNTYVHQNPLLWGSYEAEVDNVRRYMTERFEWMDNKLGFDATTLDIRNEASDESDVRKIMRDGQLFIWRNGVLYTPAGMRTK